MSQATMARCPVCQAEGVAGDRCWLCGQPLPESPGVEQASAEAEAVTNPYRPPTPIGETASANFPTGILVLGLILALAGVTAVAPGFGILLAIVLAPALIRTAVVVSRKRHAGDRVGAIERSTVFLASLAAVVTAGVAAFAAFAITCAASCFGLIALEPAWQDSNTTGSLFVVLIWVSVLVGAVAGGFTLYSLWKRRDAPSS